MKWQRTLNLVLIAVSISISVADAAKPRANILVVTVDDMNCDSVGAFGCSLKDTTPHIDQFATQGMMFHYAHVQVGNCFPSRNVLLSGRYPHNTKVEGFYQIKNPDYPHLVDLMKQGGYFVGIRGKASHSTPFHPYAWDADLTVIDGESQHPKNAHSYYVSTKRGIELANEAGKPFCLNINVSDPHKPFYALSGKGEAVNDRNVPSHIFEPKEVPIPGFLFDHPAVRKELAHYYSSVRRADDCFGAIMKALNESGQQDNTVVMFLSDHGMPLPFAKTALWHHSTRTPWIVRWPDVVKPGTTDKTHMISAVDMTPTLLDIAGIQHPAGFDGHSFIKVLHGHTEANRDLVYKVYNENSGGNRSPMRSVQGKRFGYLFNPWSDGNRVFKTATTGTMTYRTMQQLAATDEKIAARLKLFQHGVPEEFYDYESDPDALNNLIDDPKYAAELAKFREAMRTFMKQSKDPILAAFDQRTDPQALSAYVDRVQREADVRRAAKRKGKNGPRAKQNKKLFQLELPVAAQRGNDLVVTVNYALTPKLGEQKFHVTLKDADGKRIERIVKSAKGKGKLAVSFKVPTDFKSKTVSVATFVGEDFKSNLLIRSAGPIDVK